LKSAQSIIEDPSKSALISSPKSQRKTLIHTVQSGKTNQKKYEESKSESREVVNQDNELAIIPYGSSRKSEFETSNISGESQFSSEEVKEEYKKSDGNLHDYKDNTEELTSDWIKNITKFQKSNTLKSRAKSLIHEMVSKVINKVIDKDLK